MPVSSRIERWLRIWYRLGAGIDEVGVGCFWRVDDGCRGPLWRTDQLASGLPSAAHQWEFHSTTSMSQRRLQAQGIPPRISGVAANHSWWPCDTGVEVFKDGMAPWVSQSRVPAQHAARVAMHSSTVVCLLARDL